MSRLVRLLVIGLVAAVGFVVPAIAVAAPAPPQITTASLPSVIQGTKYPTTTLKVTGGTWPYRWSVVAGALPYGLKLSAGGQLSGATGYPYGTPIPITVQVKDAKGVTAVRDYQLVVTPFTVITPSLKNARKGAFYSATVKTNGGCINGKRLQWGVYNGTLPAGLKMSTNGVISGIPKAAGASTFVAYAECPVFNNGAAGKTFTLTVN
ncbi:hypothetical protein EFK50_17870 [Nocardioides marmoriginsengisoli]|uniref:Dystroglycan-type cadherin-like domain-containing protein n=1 Tax=Nocardioides marmoriginsengisoli TaxID=661483 RepID=A0A3N0CCS3_9ACTN|nr:putative Ig domain-containing protein [Nocardioides marmoriginsengisoli]RNL61235.1 hypothetical protein EFK50_17870 [Nocardioides marmoriginsengisoli]